MSFHGKRRGAIGLAIVALISLSFNVANATQRYSPGPYVTYDELGTKFNSRHVIEYYWSGSSGVYTEFAALYVDILINGHVLDCMFERVEYDNDIDTYFRAAEYPLPLYYSNTPRWVYRFWSASHPWASGQYVKYINQIRDEVIFDDYPSSCGGYATAGMGGWSSAINTSHQWLHIHISH